MSISVLIVEDDVEAAGILSGLLAFKIPDLAIYVAQNGRLGVESAQEHRPEIVITDINMPDMDGIQMVREITQFTPDTRFIVITGYSSKTKDFGNLLIHDYFVKPTDFRKLLDAVETCIGEIIAGGSAGR